MSEVRDTVNRITDLLRECQMGSQPLIPPSVVVSPKKVEQNESQIPVSPGSEELFDEGSDPFEEVAMFDSEAEENIEEDAFVVQSGRIADLKRVTPPRKRDVESKVAQIFKEVEHIVDDPPRVSFAISDFDASPSSVIAPPKKRSPISKQDSTEIQQPTQLSSRQFDKVVQRLYSKEEGRKKRIIDQRLKAKEDELRAFSFAPSVNKSSVQLVEKRGRTSFLKREEEFLERKRENLKKLKESKKKELKRYSFKPKTNEVHDDIYLGEESVFERLQNHALQRKKHIKELKKRIEREQLKDCSFSPVIKETKKYTPKKPFMKRMEDDMERQKINKTYRKVLSNLEKSPPVKKVAEKTIQENATRLYSMGKEKLEKRGQARSAQEIDANCTFEPQLMSSPMKRVQRSRVSEHMRRASPDGKKKKISMSDLIQRSPRKRKKRKNTGKQHSKPKGRVLQVHSPEKHTTVHVPVSPPRVNLLPAQEVSVQSSPAERTTEVFELMDEESKGFINTALETEFQKFMADRRFNFDTAEFEQT
ncbi:hypothetical protein PCE1_002598 [Barthelona sp. PCE]